MSAGENILSSLLEQEYFLVRVFNWLLDDGLQECRLVCKKWYDVSRKMPVTLTPTLTDMSTCNRMERFPNVKGVVFDYTVKLENVMADHKWGSRDISEEFTLTSDGLRFLASFKNLTHVGLRNLFFTNVYDISLEEWIQYLSHLHSLDLGVLLSQTDRNADLMWLAHLTDLKALTLLDGFGDYHENPIQLTSLSKIERLKTMALDLVDDSGCLTFPSLTKLTHLTLRHFCSREGRKVLSPTLSAIECYASSLRCLVLERCSENASNKDICSLSLFTHLECLKLCPLKSCLDLSLLNDMSCLTELCIDKLYLSKSAARFLGSLVNLRSLGCLKLVRGYLNRGDDEDCTAEDLFVHLKQLTKLSIGGPKIEKLDISEQVGAFDVAQAVGSLVKLESLELNCLGIYVPNSALSGLTKLKCLKLAGVSVDEDIFLTLETLLELTDLHLSVVNMGEVAYKGNLMTQLVSLTLDTGDGIDSRHLKSFKEGWFSRLQHFEYSTFHPSSKDKKDLRARMPCLRRLLVHVMYLFDD